MGSRILLADDSITIQKVVNLTFADEGIEVVAVSNGDLAERRLNEVKPDLVLADIFMPGKNGYELCEVIKQNPLFRNVPVVLLVGAFEPFDQAEARRVQADAHLTKPFESRTLVETVRRLISESGRATTGPIAPMPSPGEGREDMHQADPMPPRVTTSTAPKLDASEMRADANVPTATSTIGNTGELGSSRADAAQQGVDIGVQGMPAHGAVDASSTGASEEFDPMELASIGELPHAETQSSSVQDQPDMFLDFDKAEPLESWASQGTDSFEAEASFHTEADAGGSGNGAEWFSQDDSDGRAMQMPSTNNGWQATTTTAPLNGHAADFGKHNEAAFATSEGSTETACATMLAVDDPLGDVLHDEGILAGVLPLGHDLLGIELTEPAVTEALAVADTQFDLVDTADGSSDSPHAYAGVEDRIEDELELRDTERGLKLTDQPDPDTAGLSSDSQGDLVESDDILDWTSPNAGNYSSAQPDSVMMPIDAPESQLDSVMMPIDIVESQPDSMPIDIVEPQPDSVMTIDTSDSQTDNPAETSALEVDNTQEASFESARMWPEEEARFAAIDIEAFPVEESGAPAQLEATETGFSPVTLEQSGPSVEVPVMDYTSSKQPTNGATSSTELSSATIEEIVRRVVAEMSDSVVREVAWEVVPDCVERVIDQLTRESLSKRA
jgi:CheY-like chemotaxis protein